MTDAPERIWAAQCRNTHSTMWWSDDAGGVGTEYIRADLARPKAKQLKWVQLGDGKGRDIYSTIHWARSPFGSYYIGLQPRGENPFDWAGPTNSGERGFEAADAAKAAAQADYERRWLEALE